jgi:hypothetical protein
MSAWRFARVLVGIVSVMLGGCATRPVNATA